MLVCTCVFKSSPHANLAHHAYLNIPHFQIRIHHLLLDSPVQLPLRCFTIVVAPLLYRNILCLPPIQRGLLGGQELVLLILFPVSTMLGARGIQVSWVGSVL